MSLIGRRCDVCFEESLFGGGAGPLVREGVIRVGSLSADACNECVTWIKNQISARRENNSYKVVDSRLKEGALS